MKVIITIILMTAVVACSSSPFYGSVRTVSISAVQRDGDRETSATLIAAHEGAAWYGDQGTTASLHIGPGGEVAAGVADETGKESTVNIVTVIAGFFAGLFTAGM